MFRYEPRGCVREQRSDTITTPTERQKSTDDDKLSITSQETIKHRTTLDEESMESDDEVIKRDEEPIRPDVKQNKSNIQLIEPKMHTSYEEKETDPQLEETKKSLTSRNTLDDEMAAMITKESTLKLQYTELVDYRVRICLFFSRVQSSRLQLSCISQIDYNIDTTKNLVF